MLQHHSEQSQATAQKWRDDVNGMCATGLIWSNADEVLAVWHRLRDVTRDFTDLRAFLHCGWCGGRLTPLMASNDSLIPSIYMCIENRHRWTGAAPDRRSIYDRSFRTTYLTAPRDDRDRPILGDHMCPATTRDELTCHPSKCGRTHLVRGDRLMMAYLRVREAGGRNVIIGNGGYARRVGGHHL